MFGNWRRWISSVFLVLAVVFFIRYAALYMNDLPHFDWGITQWATMLASILLYATNISIAGFIWQLLLLDHGLRPSWWLLQIIFSIVQFAKYLPGNVAQHVGRVYMAKAAGIPVSATIHTMVIEALFEVGIGAALALLSLLFVIDATTLRQTVVVQPFALGMLMLTTLLLPWLAVRSLNKFFPRLASKISGDGPIVEPRFHTALVVACLFLSSFFIIGLVLKLHAVYLFAVAKVPVLKFTALFAVAWVAGYLVPGAPAGLGIREALIVILFSPMVGPAVAVGLGVSLRITTTLGDALAFVMGLTLRGMMMH